MSRKKINDLKSNNQNITMGDVNIQKGRLNIRQQIASQNESTSITTQKEFIDELGNVIDLLSKYRGSFQVTQEALNELKSAKLEASKETANPSIIRRFLNNARGILEDVAGGVTDISTIAASLAALSKLVSVIFGS